MSAPRPPEAVGPVSGLTPPARLPWIGTEVVDPDGSVGFVAHYQYYDRDQVWFPVLFPEGDAVKTRRRRLGKNANRVGYVRLAKPDAVTSLAAARKPPREPAGHAAAS